MIFEVDPKAEMYFILLKSLPRFDSWVQKIPLEKSIARDSSILARRIPWIEEPSRYSPRVTKNQA